MRQITQTTADKDECLEQVNKQRKSFTGKDIGGSTFQGCAL